MFIGKVLHYYKSIDSTNEVAKNMLSNSKPSSGTAIIAEFQTNGKGQQYNTWEADSGKNLLCSIILNHEIPVEDFFYLNKIISISIVETLDNLLVNEKIQIKWPNDILVNKKKIAGILIENSVFNYSIQNSIVGFGININQTNFKHETATSVIQFLKSEIDITSFTTSLFEKIDNWYQNYIHKKYYIIDNVYLKLLYGINEKVLMSINNTTFLGNINSLNKDGSIIVKNNTTNTYHTCYFKQIKFIL